MFFDLRTKFKLASLVFIGFFAPTHRGLEDLTNLSLSRLQIVKDKKDSAWGYTQFQPKLLMGMNSGCGSG
jgi:hypothetical protein